MSVIHLLLNLAALLLWLTAVGPKAEPATGRPLTLAAQIQPTQNRPQRRWTYLLGLGVLLFVRAIFYRHLGPTVDWVARWCPGPVTVSFRSDIFSRMVLFSVVGFAWSLFVFYSSLLFVCAIHPRTEPDDGVTRLVRQHLGWVGSWPRLLQALLPFLALAALWWPTSYFFASTGLLPKPDSLKIVYWQSLIVGLGGWLSWRWVLSVLLIVGFTSSHIYFGRHPFWEFVDSAYRQIRKAVRWLPLRIGRIDLAAPLLLGGVSCATWILWEGVPRPITSRVPILEPWEVPRLRRWYSEVGAEPVSAQPKSQNPASSTRTNRL